MANAALNVNLDDLSGYEKLDVYLKDDGSLQQRGIGDDRSEADGVGEIIFGVGIQVCAAAEEAGPVEPAASVEPTCHLPPLLAAVQGQGSRQAARAR